MYKNIGGKIKWMARIACILGVIVSVIGGLAIMFLGGGISVFGIFRSVAWYMVLLGILVMAAGSFLSWVGSFFIYGIGQLIENSDIIANYYRNKRY